MHGNNPHWPYHLTDTVHFAYNGKEVWGTIMKFGDGSVKMLTKDGYKHYIWKEMSDIVLYQCCVKSLALNYQRYGDERFKYLYDHYGINRSQSTAGA